MKIRVLFLTIVLSLNSCISASKLSEDTTNELGNFGKISLGDSREKAIGKLGEPAAKSEETYGSVVFEVLEYNSLNGLPKGHLHIDSNNQTVSGKGLWISSQEELANLSYVKENLFPHAAFEDLKACDKHWGSQFKIDQKQGIFIGLTRGMRVILISWSSPELTQLRLRELRQKCSDLQK